MKRTFLAIAAAGVFCASVPALAAGPSSVGVGDWKSGSKGSVETVTVDDAPSGEARVDKVRVDGEDIYLNGVLQEEKYVPGARIELTDGRVLVLPPEAGASAP